MDSAEMCSKRGTHRAHHSTPYSLNTAQQIILIAIKIIKHFIFLLLYMSQMYNVKQNIHGAREHENINKKWQMGNCSIRKPSQNQIPLMVHQVAITILNFISPNCTETNLCPGKKHITGNLISESLKTKGNLNIHGRYGSNACDIYI